jgi:hypothetical protein
MKLKQRILLVYLGPLSIVSTAFADTPVNAAPESPIFPPGSFLLQAMSVLIVIACVLAALKFYTSIRGGRVGRGWMWVFCGFLVFAGAQLLLFGGQLGVLPLLLIWVDALRVVSLLLFFVGINQLRKIMA